MTWLRVDDGALTHPKTMRLRSLGARTNTADLAEAVIGFVVLAASWSGKHNTDCLILESVGPLASPARWLELSDAAIAVGIMTAAVHPSGEAAWLVDISDHLFHLLSAAEVEQNRERRNAPRRNAARVEVLLRDGDVCRYCAHTVNPYDSSWGGWGRHFEHPDPTVPDEMVVACQQCNLRKSDRTPDEAGLVLRPPPDAPKYWHPKTLEWLRRQGCTEADGLPPPGTPLDGNQPPSTARPGSNQLPDPAPPRPGTQPDTAPQPPRSRTKGAPTPAPNTSRASPDPAPTLPPPSDPPTPGSAEPPSAGTGRDGQGRDGSGRAAPTSARTRRRGRRGRPRGGGRP
jgi:hypothetical protein